jgi:ABC-2 type transport system ATP-binding protein
MIEVEHLSKRFGASVAVDDVSFAVGRGEVVGFLGPNGAGKTTTIRVLTCYHPASEGSARVAGFDVVAESMAVRRSIGYLPENVPLYPDMRVEEYLRYRAALKGVPRSRRRAHVEEAMERCGVVEVRRKMVGHVSRGYRQRVGLADALVAKPPILILDEPTSGLDPNQRRRMKDLIRELAREHTILFSSHILAEVADVSSRVLVIHQGKLCADGRIEELLARSPGRELRVIARAESALLRELVSRATGGLPARAAAVRGDDDGFAEVFTALSGVDDPRDAVSAALREQGIAIRELSLHLPTLEQFFAHVTGLSDPHSAAAKRATDPAGDAA